MSYDIGPKIGVEGEAAFKQSISAVNAQLKSMGAEMKAVVSAYDAGDQSTEKLTAQNEVLGRSVDATKQKITLLKGQFDQEKATLTTLGAALEKATAEHGANSAEAAKAQNEYNRQAAAVTKLGTQINSSTADLNKMERELKDNTSALEGTGDEVKDLGKDLDDAGGHASTFGDMLKANLTSQAIIGGIKAIAAAIGDVAGKLRDTVVNAAYAADDLNTMSKQYDISTADLQKFQYATEQIDVPLETLTGSMSKMTKNMATASKGTGDAYTAFRSLGVEIKNQDGTLRDRNDVFNEAINALGGMDNATQRDALAMQIFGKSAQDLNPLILGGADALKEYGDQAEAAGLILGQDTLDKLNLVSDAMDTFKATSSAAGNLFSAAFAEPIAGAVNAVTGYIQQLTGAYASGGFSALSTEIGTVLSSLVSDIVTALPGIVNAGTQILMSLLQGVVQMLPQVAQAATTIITQLVSGIGQALPTLILAMVGAVTTMVQGLLDAIPMLIDAALELITGLADGLIDAIPVLLEALPEIIDSLVDGLLDSIPKIIDAGVQLLVSLVEAMPKIISGIVAVLPQIISSIVDALVNNIPLLVQAGVQLFMALVQNLPAIIVEIVKAVPQIVGAIVDGFGALAGSVADIGKNIITGVWDGIVGMATWIRDKVTGFFGGIVDGVKGFLGIHSPSKVFAQLGEYTAEGFAEGMRAEQGNAVKTAEEFSASILSAAADWVSDKQFYDDLAASDEVEFWEQLKKIGGMGAKELEQVNKKLYAAKKSASKEAYNYSKKWIDNEKKYNDLSAEDEIEAWERVVNRHNLGADEQMDAEEALYTARKTLAQSAADAEQKLADEQQKALETYQANVEKRAESLRSFAGLFDEIKTDADVSGQDLLQNLRDQVKAFQGWQSDIAKLGERGVTGPLLDELTEMGPKAADQIHALTTMTDKQLTEYADLYAEKAKLAADQAQAEAGAVDVPIRIVAGEEELTANASAVTAAVDSAMEGIKTGLTEKMPEVANVAHQIGEAIQNTLAGMYGNFVETGRSLADGVIAGFRSGIAQLAPQMAAVSAGVYQDSYRSASGRENTTRTVSTAQTAAYPETINLNATFEMDGAVLARKSYKYNVREGRIQGSSFVEGAT